MGVTLHDVWDGDTSCEMRGHEECVGAIAREARDVEVARGRRSGARTLTVSLFDRLHARVDGPAR